MAKLIWGIKVILADGKETVKKVKEWWQWWLSTFHFTFLLFFLRGVWLKVLWLWLILHCFLCAGNKFGNCWQIPSVGHWVSEVLSFQNVLSAEMSYIGFPNFSVNSILKFKMLLAHPPLAEITSISSVWDWGLRNTWRLLKRPSTGRLSCSKARYSDGTWRGHREDRPLKWGGMEHARFFF